MNKLSCFKKIFIILMLLFLQITLISCGENSGTPNPPNDDILDNKSVEGIKVKMTIDSQVIFIKLVDSTASRDFVNHLKNSSMKLEFRDFAGSEKVATPNPLLDISNTSGCNPIVGDFTIYKPWGNFAAFYRDTSGYSSDLTLIGKIEDNGITILAEKTHNFYVIIEL